VQIAVLPGRHSGGIDRDHDVIGVDFDEVIIETRCPGIWRRYELALQARNEHIYVQDDDCRPNVALLLSTYDGRRMTNAVRPGHYRNYLRTGHTLPSWGAFFPKRLINFDRWTARHGTLMRRHVFGPDGSKVDRCEDDRIFSWLARPRVNPVVMSIPFFARSASLAAEPGAMESRARCHKLLEAL
jgi:hypothetical protein